MPTKQPVPPPKFNIGDLVSYKDVAYRVTNRRYTIGPWKYDLVEQGVLKPRHKVVVEDLLCKLPLQPAARFNAGDKVLHTVTKEVYEVQSRVWNSDNKWLYTISRYLPHAPGGEPETDTMYRIPQEFLVPSTEEPKGFFDDVDGVWVDEPNPQIIEQKSKFKIDDYVRYNGFTCQVVMLDYNDERKEYQYEIKTHPGGRTYYYRINESELSFAGLYDLPKDNQIVTNENGGKQSFVSARFDCIPPVVLRLLAQCLGFGARKYGKDNWKNIEQWDHLNHAMNHINEWNRGDRNEPHLVNAMARLTFALSQAVEQNQQPDTYTHPEEKHS